LMYKLNIYMCHKKMGMCVKLKNMYVF